MTLTPPPQPGAQMGPPPHRQQPSPQPRQPQNPRPPRHRAAMATMTALSALLSLPSAWLSLNAASPGLRNSDLRARLAELSGAHPDLSPYLVFETVRRARLFMNGVQAYRVHPARRGAESAPVVWRRGAARVRDYAPRAHPEAPAVFVVPSLINRFYILDLMPEHSLLAYMAAQGFRPLVIDWGVPGEEEKNYDLDAYIRRVLIPAAMAAARGRNGLHIVGYCMGGLFALALAQARPELTRTLSLLATPWDFHAGEDRAAQAEAGAALETYLNPWLETGDLLPVDVIQGIFTALQPMQALHKFSSFAAMDPESAAARRFVLAEDWLNDGVPLPARAARESFGDWCARNAAAQGAWRVGGETIDPAKILRPAYAVVPGRDRIVPPESALPLARALPHATCVEPDLGHIGIMASTRAPSMVWQPFVDWIGSH